MLDYMRNKLVNIVYDDGVFLAHGVLDDDIYSVEVDLKIDEKELIIREVKGRWHRYTTPECPRAEDFLNEAVGVKIDAGFADKVHRKVGRKSCRHFANIIIECCYSVKEAIKVLEKKNVLKEVKKEVKERRTKSKEKKTEDKMESGIVIDLHVHTKEASPCSAAEVDKIIARAIDKKLNGICITDHSFMWDKDEIDRLREKYNFLILRGNEITTDQGDILVFGMYENIKGIIGLSELRNKVDSAGGVMIAAHPFRGFLAFSGDDIGLTSENAAKRELFKYVDGVEVLNGKVTEKENSFAKDVAANLNLALTGGSDVHSVNEVGKYATCFFGDIKDENDLIEAIKSRSCRAVIV